MTRAATIVSARRFLHVGYGCHDAATSERFLADALGLTVTMRTAAGPADGSVLGYDGPVDADVSFAFDRRGPRASPGIEVQGWNDPVAVGEAYGEPHHAGIQAVGIAVCDLARTLDRLDALGLSTTQPFAMLSGPPTASVRDPAGVSFDLVELAELETDEARLHHVRITCTDLDRTCAWYQAIGFELVDVESGGFLGRARMRLPDEQVLLYVDEWEDPPTLGFAYEEPHHVGFYRMALAVDDTHDAVARWTAAGGAVDRGPMLVELDGTPVPDLWVAFVEDPDGIPVEFVERPRSAFR